MVLARLREKLARGDASNVETADAGFSPRSLSYVLFASSARLGYTTHVGWAARYRSDATQALTVHGVAQCDNGKGGDGVRNMCRLGRGDKRRLQITAAAIALLAGGAALAALSPAALAASPIKCGSVITTDRTLQSNIGPCSGNGLVVRGNDITLNLNGFAVSGKKSSAETSGVLLDGVTGSTVRGGTVTGFDAGVNIEGGSGNTVRSMTAVNNINDNTGSTTDKHGCVLGDGITAYDSDANTITANTVVHNGPFSGISLLTDADNNTVSNNTVENSNVANVRPGGRIGNCGSPFSRPIQDIGIRIEGPGANGNLVTSNRVVNSAIGGITIHGYVFCPPLPGGGCGPSEDQNSGNVIQFNFVADTGRDTYTMDPLADGIGVLRQGPGNTVGVSQGNTIANNTVLRSYEHGIYLGNPTQPGAVAGNVVVGNTIRESLFDGILIPDGSVNNTIDSNTAQGSGEHDGHDANTICDNNLWTNNVFTYVNQACVSPSAIIK